MSVKPNLRAPVAAAVLLALGLSASACGSDTAVEAGAEPSAQESASSTEPTLEVATDSIVGLEVTAVGNVSELVDENAFRLDRDGLGSASDKVEDEPEYDYGYYDYDYYDYGELTLYDEEFEDEDAVDEGVLVLNVGKSTLALEDKVRVSGTIRRFDQAMIEQIYDVDLLDETWVDYEDRLVLVAHSVNEVRSAGAATDSRSSSGDAGEGGASGNAGG